MERLSRAQTQQLNRARVLRAARQEFAERGFREAKVDGIAERAGLTRGAVYSNFPGKRALYFAVLAELAEQAPSRNGPSRTCGPARRWAPSPAPGSPGSRSPPTTGTAAPGSAWICWPR
ncbi:TetR/AcrR family transcriptional regulator [Nonomuraea recticatena]|uniref:TetR/AcrR family transcriptional regulator n=1 Tax=Nonomuraea recticatena TaxID=46178 RepID=UPI003614D28B